MAAGLGTRIKRARERKRWTQQQLADALSVNIKTVDNWENGRTSPRSSIGALEAVLGVRLDRDDDSGFRVISPQLRRMVRETLEDPDDQRRVLGLLEGTLTWPEPGEQAEPEAGEHRPAAG